MLWALKLAAMSLSHCKNCITVVPVSITMVMNKGNLTILMNAMEHIFFNSGMHPQGLITVNAHVPNAKKLVLQSHDLYNILNVHALTLPNAYSFFNLIVLGEDYLIS